MARPAYPGNRKLINIRIEVGVLADFDAWCEEHRVTRTAAIENYMRRQASAEQVRKILKPVSVRVPPVQGAARGKKDLDAADCAHPLGMRIGGVCMICGKDIKGARQ